MKEFTSQTGGRFTYVDDFLNLQELALAISEIFSDCDNFIVSGCEVSGNSISSGLVYLNGKLRIVEGVSAIQGGWPQYIYEVNENKNVPYASGDEKIGREVWGACIGKVIPTAKTPLTNAVPKAITVTSAGGVRMKDAWFGKYALLLNPKAASQTVEKIVNMDTLNVTGVLTGSNRYKLQTTDGTGTWFYNGADMVIQSELPKSTFKILMDSDSGQFKFSNNDIQIATFGIGQASFMSPVVCSLIHSGNLKVAESDVYDFYTSSDNGSVRINMLGYGDSAAYYRDTLIGNGKGVALLTISGLKNIATLKTRFDICSGVKNPINLQADQISSDTSLLQYIQWKDRNGVYMATVGYSDSDNSEFIVKNSVGGVRVYGTDTVDIGPAIKENGVLLSEKYALQSTMTQELGNKANASDVYKTSQLYTAAQCDQKFAVMNGAFLQFINSSVTAETLRGQIGAASSTALGNYIRKDQLLADIAVSESNKAKIRENIGAAAKDEYQNDTGWVAISGTTLYARQIGDIVSIQGTITTQHTGTVFSLPNNISSPRFAVKYSIGFANNRTWVCKIDAGSRACTVVYCDSSCYNITEFSLTYMA